MLRSAYIRSLLIMLLLSCCFAQHTHAQADSASSDLRLYVNDTLGFSLLLPGPPYWVPKDGQYGGGEFLGFRGEDMSMTIMVEKGSPLVDLDLDTLLRQKYMAEFSKDIQQATVDGETARRASFAVSGRRVTAIATKHKNALYIFTLYRPEASPKAKDEQILDSIRFN